MNIEKLNKLINSSCEDDIKLAISCIVNKMGCEKLKDWVAGNLEFNRSGGDYFRFELDGHVIHVGFKVLAAVKIR